MTSTVARAELELRKSAESDAHPQHEPGSTAELVLPNTADGSRETRCRADQDPGRSGRSTGRSDRFMDAGMEGPTSLTIRGVDYSGSVVDGPGIRTVLFLQGCQQRCTGCHNPETWDVGAGVPVLVSNLAGHLRERIANRKLTISGGEPLLQSQAILRLVKELPGFSIALYTGMEFDEIPVELLGYLDFVKTGRYIAEKRCTAIPYIGSTNQRLVDLRGRAR